MTLPDSSEARPAERARRAGFSFFLAGLAADMIGDQVWFIALAWAASATGDASVVASIIAIGTVPRMLLLIPAGTLVDRLGALRMAQTAQAARIATMLLALAVVLLAPRSVPLLMAVAFIFGIADAIRM